MNKPTSLRTRVLIVRDLYQMLRGWGVSRFESLTSAVVLERLAELRWRDGY